MNLKGKNTQKDREKLVKTFAQDISLFTAYVLEPYITRPFSPFHLELFQELYGMVLRFVNKTGNLQNNLQAEMAQRQAELGCECISSGKMGSKAQTIADGYREIAIRNKVDSSPITLNLSGKLKDTPSTTLSKEEQEEVNIGRILLGDDKSLDSLETGPRIGGGGVSGPMSSRINQAPADFTSQNEISNAERSVGQSAVSVVGHEIKEVEGLLLCMERKRLCSCLMEVLDAREGNESVTSTKYEIRMEGAERLVVAAPRGFAKSTIAAEAFPLWCICNRVCEFILIVSETEDQAKMRLDMIRNELEHNERLRGLYGDLVGKENWGSFEIETLNGVKVVVKGTGQKIRGLKYRRKRPELVICDDIMAEDTVEQEEQRGKVKRWFYGTVIPGVSLDGMMLFIGTVLHEDDILVELLSAPDWRGMRRKVIEDGKPLWPEAFSMERIENIRREYTQRGQLHLFYREYMNEILASEEAAFTRECFQYVDEKELVKRVEQDGELFKVFLTMDIAYQTEGRSDYTALVVTYMDEDHNLYVAEVVRARMGLMQTIDKIFDVVDEYVPSRVGIQNVDWTRSLKVPLIEEMRRRGKGFVVTPLQTYSRSISGMSSKKARIERLAPRYHAQQIYHVTKNGSVSRGIMQLEEELLLHPRQKYDDCCFEAGTKVSTLWGEKNIEEIQLGEFVFGPLGLSRVTQTGSRRAKTIERIGLHATPDHKIFTTQGFKSLETLTEHQGLDRFSLCGLIRWEAQRWLSGTEEPINSWGREHIIFVSQNGTNKEGELGLKDFMWTCMRRLFKPSFRKGLWSIIKMGIHFITILLTYSCYRIGNIQKFIQTLIGNQDWTKPKKRPRFGTDPKKDALGTDNTLVPWFLQRKIWFVSFVEKISSLFLKTHAFVPIFAETKLDPKRQNFLRLPAWFVEKKERLDQKKPPLISVDAKNFLSATDEKTVYNLTTTRGVFYANQILVSNCDALSSCIDLAFPPQKRSERHRPLMDSEPEDYISKISGY